MLDLTRVGRNKNKRYILALEKIQAISETTNMNSFRIEDELFTGIFRHKAGIDKIGIYPDIVQGMLKEKPVHGAKDYQVHFKIAYCFFPLAHPDAGLPLSARSRCIILKSDKG